CLVELERRGWDLERYLANRPDLPAELVELLRTALRLHLAPHPTPSPRFKQRSAERLMALVRSEVRESPPLTRARFLSTLNSDRSIFPRRAAGWNRLLFTPFAALLVVAIGAGTLKASSSALPEDRLYPIKLVSERAMLTLSPAPALKTRSLLIAGEHRVSEM